jgi:hypothetical protein
VVIGSHRGDPAWGALTDLREFKVRNEFVGILVGPYLIPYALRELHGRRRSEILGGRFSGQAHASGRSFALARERTIARHQRLSLSATGMARSILSETAARLRLRLPEIGFQPSISV